MIKITKTFSLFIFTCICALILVACDKKEDKISQNSQISTNSTISTESPIQTDDTNEQSLEEADSNKTITNIETTESIDSNKTIENTSTATIKEDNNQDVLSSIEAPINASDLYKKCAACHGVKGDKVAPGSVGNVLIYTLSKDSIVESLKGYKARTLSKGGTAAIMYLQSTNLSHSDMEALGEYISNLNK